MTTPKLRFKEFDGEWLFSKIGETFKVTSGSTPLRSDNRFFENADIAWVKTTDLNNGLIEKTEEKISQIALKETSIKILPKGTVFVAMYGGFNQIGRTGLLVDEAACNQALSAIYPNEKIESYFLLTFLNHKVDEWKNFAASSRKDPNITKSDVLAFPLTYPSKEEQTKIASFLSAVDEKISQLTQKHQLLSQYKQGMMQKLFSQQIRFKADDGSEFGEWEVVILKDILISYRLGGNYSNSETQTPYPLIKMGNLGRGSINLDKIEYIPSEEKIDVEDLIKTNDLFFNTRNTLDLVGKVAIWRDELPQAYYNSNLMRLKFENNIFMNYLFNERNTLEKLKSIASGTTSVAAIYTKDLLKINLEIPCLEEQTKIANFLSAIDQKIDVASEQLEQAKLWKKGLLQQMFV